MAGAVVGGTGTRRDRPATEAAARERGAALGVRLLDGFRFRLPCVIYLIAEISFSPNIPRQNFGSKHKTNIPMRDLLADWLINKQKPLIVAKFWWMHLDVL